MKQYIIDELRPGEHKKIAAYLKAHYVGSEVEGIFWVPLPEEILTAEQAAHTDCKPLYFAVDIEPNLISCELLVRTRNRMRCGCIAYATEAQRNWLIDVVDGMFAELKIAV